MTKDHSSNNKEKSSLELFFSLFFSGFLKILKRSLTLFLPTFIMFLHELN